MESPISEPISERKYASQFLGARLSVGLDNYVNHLLGEILTIIDAAFQDQEQRKAVKDLVKKSFYSQNNRENAGIEYAVVSVSKYLRSFSKEADSEESTEYREYMNDLHSSIYSPELEKDLKKARLG